MSHEEYRSAHGKDSMAICLKHHRKIVLTEKYVDIHTIRHELVHAYVASCCVESMHIKGDDMEELLCEVLSYHLEDIGKYSRKIFNTFKGKWGWT